MLQKSIRYACYSYLAAGGICAFAAAPALQGQTGYINMPSALVEPDGTFSFGYSYDKPYGSIWATSTILPFLQLTGRYVSISGIPGFTNDPNAYGGNYGRYKDKVFDAKVRLWDESAWLPAVALGRTDLQGTELFKGSYVVATKTFGASRNIEASVGRGSRRPDGLFAGARWTPAALPNWSLVAEYDANDYPHDFRASQTFAGERSKGMSVGAEYRWGWLGLQVARHPEHTSINAYVTIPLSEREYIPKIYEPPYYQPKEPPAKVTIEQWQQDPAIGAAMVDALAQQDFKNVRVQLSGHTLDLTLTNSRISNLGRAIGRAARVALAFAPQDIRGIHITYTRLEQPVATYEFFDLPALTDYLAGRMQRQQFLDKVLVRYANRDDIITADQEGLVSGIKDTAGLDVLIGRDGDVVQLASEDRESNRFKIAPKLGFFFNDPSGALRYDLTASATYDRRLDEGLYLNSALSAQLSENVSGVTQPSNSELPHVRTDVADYKRNGRIKLNQLLLNKYKTLDERWYARASAGIYEEMFRGAGGQVLYLPTDSRWAADLSVDALQQRDFQGWFGARDYHTVTAIGALHYRLPYGITVTARAGRFLAKDVGARMEFKRRFASGIEIGGWYTRTNGNDITSPGTPAAPYHDKGIFLTIPLYASLPNDTQATAGFALSPWTRDVGQMVASPGDLYDLMENPRRDLTTGDGLGNFAERADERNNVNVTPPEARFENPWPLFRQRLANAASAAPVLSDAVVDTALGVGSVGVAALADDAVNRYAQRHDGSSFGHGLQKFGKAAPLAAVGVAGLAVALGDDRMQRTGITAIESAGIAAVAGSGLKYITDRARPDEERGHLAQSASRGDSSFPSNHVGVAFAALTPFAKEYDAPWLYAAAALTGAGRIADHKHWLSDVVAGGLVGYAAGNWLWQGEHRAAQEGLALQPMADGMALTWRKKY